MKRGKIIWSAIGISVLILTIIFIVRTIQLEKMYPTPKITRIAMGESLHYNGCMVTIKEAALLKPEDVDIPNIENYLPTDKYEARLFKVKMRIENVSDSPASISPTSFVIQNNAFRNGVDLMMLYELNLDDLPPKTYEAGEAHEFYLPFTAHSNMFPTSQWKQLNLSDFDLVVTTYPIKYIMALTP